MAIALTVMVVLAGLEPRVEKVTSAFNQPGCPALFAMLSPPFQKALPQDSWPRFCDSVGALTALTPTTNEPGGWLSFLASTPHGPVRLDVGFDAESRVTGLKVTPVEPAPVASSVEDGLRQVRQKYQLPGLSALVLRADGSTTVYSAGVRRADAAAQVTADDRWHLGSNTKAMTATLAAMLVDEKKLSWTSTVAEVFSDWKDLDPAFKDITLQMLLSHRGGLVANAPREAWVKAHDEKDPARERKGVVHELLRRAPTAPGTFAYSNAGYMVAGAMLEKASGLTWESLMRTRLFEPLDMKSCGFGAPATKGRVDQPWGHTRPVQGQPYQPVAPGGPGADNPASMGPAGTVHCSLGDYAKFLALHLAGGNDLVSVDAMDHLHAAPEKGGTYALGWGLADRPWAGGAALTHRGSNTTFFVTAWLSPARHFALVVATNAGDDGAEQAMTEAIGVLVAHAVR